MTGGSRGSVDAGILDARICFRLSSFGRNIEGVCSTDGAAEGGLKMMWSWLGESLERRKAESGLTLRRCLVRRVDDSCRRPTEERQNRHWDLDEMRSMRGRLSNADSMAESTSWGQADKAMGDSSRSRSRRPGIFAFVR